MIVNGKSFQYALLQNVLVQNPKLVIIGLKKFFSQKIPKESADIFIEQVTKIVSMETFKAFELKTHNRFGALERVENDTDMSNVSTSSPVQGVCLKSNSCVFKENGTKCNPTALRYRMGGFFNLFFTVINLCFCIT